MLEDEQRATQKNNNSLKENMRKWARRKKNDVTTNHPSCLNLPLVQTHIVLDSDIPLKISNTNKISILAIPKV